MPEIKLTAMAYGGEALGRLPDGRVVFVAGALPGEIVRAEISEEKHGHTRARLLEVLQPSPIRISPRCPHFGVCGGCHYQHMPYTEQLSFKSAIFREQIQRLADVPQPTIMPMVSSQTEWNYRNTIQFHINPEGKPGFQISRSHHILPVLVCHLPEAAICDTWPRLDLQPGHGLSRAEFRCNADGDILLILDSPEDVPPEMILDLPLSIVHLGPDGSHLMAGEDHIYIEVLGRFFHVSAGSFFQVNTLQAAAMADHLVNALDLDQNFTLLDVYCGVGLFSATLAPLVKRVAGVEISPSACADYTVNMDEFDDVVLYEGAAEDILPYLEMQPDVIVVDPPRRGLGKEVLEGIIRLNPHTLAYVSCDPATLCRDLKTLMQAGYLLRSVTPFDLFPQTYHIETVVIMDRK